MSVLEVAQTTNSEKEVERSCFVPRVRHVKSLNKI